MSPRTRSRVAALCSLLPLLAACDGGGTRLTTPQPGVGAPPTGFVDLLITDAAVDELVAFAVVVSEVRLSGPDGTTDDLLPVDARVELLGLGDDHEWLAGARVPARRYDRMLVRFAPFAYEARRLDGARLLVDAVVDELDAPLALPLDLRKDDYQRVVADLDLDLSLQGSPAGGSVVLDPRGTARVVDPAEAVALEDLDATVAFRDVGAGTLLVDGFVDAMQTAPLGQVPILVGATTLLVDRTGATVAPPPLYFTLLSPGVTLLEIHGELLDGGFVRARRIEIEEQNGVPLTKFPVKLEGRIELVGPSGVLTLRLRDVDRGATFALPVLFGLGDPATVELAVSFETRIYAGERPLTLADLAAGQEIEVKFETFPGEPFPARRIEVTRPAGP